MQSKTIFIFDLVLGDNGFADNQAIANLPATIQDQPAPENTNYLGNHLRTQISNGSLANNPTLSADDLRPSDIAFASMLNKYYSTPQTQQLSRNDYYPDADRPINGGNYSGSTFSAPIAVGGPTAVPMAMYDARKAAMQKAALNALMMQQPPDAKVPKTYSGFQEDLSNNFNNTLQGFLSLAKQYGPSGMIMLQNPSTTLGAKFKAFKDGYAALANQGQDLAKMSMQIQDDSEDPNKYVSPETLAVARMAISGADDISKNLHPGSYIFNRAMNHLQSSISLDHALATTYDKLKQDMNYTENAAPGSNEYVTRFKNVEKTWLDPSRLDGLAKEIVEQNPNAQFTKQQVIDRLKSMYTMQKKPSYSEVETQYGHEQSSGKGDYGKAAEILLQAHRDILNHTTTTPLTNPVSGGYAPVLKNLPEGPYSISHQMNGWTAGSRFVNENGTEAHPITDDEVAAEPGIGTAGQYQKGVRKEDNRVKYTLVNDNTGVAYHVLDNGQTVPFTKDNAYNAAINPLLENDKRGTKFKEATDKKAVDLDALRAGNTYFNGGTAPDQPAQNPNMITKKRKIGE